MWPVIYLLFWGFLLIFSLYSEPLVCGIGLLIMLTGVPVYYLGVYWENKPEWFDRGLCKHNGDVYTWTITFLLQLFDSLRTFSGLERSNQRVNPSRLPFLSEMFYSGPLFAPS